MVHLPEDAPSPRLCIVEKSSPDQVVERIKENALRCEMLVISEEGAQWYNERGIEINLKLPNIQRICDDANRRNAKANGSPPPAAGWYAPTTKHLAFLVMVVVYSLRNCERYVESVGGRRDILCSLLYIGAISAVL
uniref:Transposase n=1 Tax=Angiostrongylus cantonensis TaxID=6313 RepID=A0A0K0CYB8_ANGCA